ncbi:MULTISPECIES: bifunctional sterol desaturase/short chain dehydrogenase [unclassified Leptolyngbya]|uniref:bifunctional sterol desaturase/short chain dehydrogenase n=1 Tax=unclassified Leptolyngbya TaxID=2650499 RepID=UPI001689AE62|nr:MULTISPECIES: bifunctional sterol desaturase/short chain dehydrogenase [unclassified Leptolyngbya]MBD1912633.1 bifunctional sterol desaturase/short chain dehydrogenase [Leptolyngbya sp. FACHB-8]MBD2156803.1 bifunctional sterol desaturase/short chain dehydrogenase [Leptolyngbya sp. FACHB-16]
MNHQASSTHQWLAGQVVAITGASGTLGRSLTRTLLQEGAKVLALTTSQNSSFQEGVEVVCWQAGQEEELRDRLQSINILIINHGINVHGDRSPAAIQKSFQVNTFSAWNLAELFLSTVDPADSDTLKELWINTSEAEVGPAISPLYELSKRTLGHLITLRRLDAPCVIRKLILGPFKSNLNPIGVMSADWVGRAIVFLAKRGFRNIIVTINPLTYLAFPLKEVSQSLYFQLFSKSGVPS